MKDLIEIILKGLSAYIPMLAAVITSPKRNIFKYANDTEDKLNKALSFGGITIAIGFVFQAPLVSAEHDFMTVAGAMLALKIVATLSFAGFILWGYRFVGGKGDYETTLCACLYITSPIYLFQVITQLVNLGILASYNPALAINLRTGQGLSTEQIQIFIESEPLAAGAFMSLFLMQILISIVWFLVCWGSYRSIHQVSVLRSAMVYLYSIVIWYTYWMASLLIMRGLYGGQISPIG